MTRFAGRIVVVTSCTGVKAPSAVPALTKEDFRRGPKHIGHLHRRFALDLIPAEELYRGQQHTRLMIGVMRARQAGLTVDLRIVSAGYGLVHADDRLAPYECTFRGTRRSERRDWARRIGLPGAVRAALEAPFALALVLLGGDYLEACRLEERLELGGPTVVFCGKAAALRLPPSAQLTTVALGREHAKLFSCGLVGLKGEVAGRLLALIATQSGWRGGISGRALVDRLAARPSLVTSGRGRAALAV